MSIYRSIRDISWMYVFSLDGVDYYFIITVQISLCLVRVSSYFRGTRLDDTSKLLHICPMRLCLI